MNINLSIRAEDTTLLCPYNYLYLTNLESAINKNELSLIESYIFPKKFIYDVQNR
jgi:hypothetical protein